MGCHLPSPGDLPHPGIEPGSPTFQADALTSEPPGNVKISQIRVCTAEAKGNRVVEKRGGVAQGFLGGASDNEPASQCRRRK